MSEIVNELMNYRRKVREFMLKLDTLIFKKYKGDLERRRWDTEDRDWFEVEDAYLGLLAEAIGLSKKGEDRVVAEVKKEIDAESDGEKIDVG